jgi:hypothetical protein
VPCVVPGWFARSSLTAAASCLALAFSPALGGCVDILGDYRTETACSCESPDCEPSQCQQSLRWLRTYGDAGEQYIGGVAVDASDNAYLVGTVLGSIDLGGGPLASAGDGDAFLAKLDSRGNHLFSLRFGNTGIDHATAVAVDPSGDVLVVGFFSGTVDFSGLALTSAGGLDMFVAKLAPDGQFLWARSYGDLFDQLAVSVAADRSGHVLVTGCMAGVVDFGAGPEASTGDLDAFVLALDPAGNRLWSKVTGGVGSDCANRVVTDPDDNVFIGGSLSTLVDFGAGPLLGSGASDIFLAKLDPGGQALWAQSFGDAADQTVGAVAAGPDGSVFLTGMFQGSLQIGSQKLTSSEHYDAFVARMSPDGQPLWSRKLPGEGDQRQYGATVDSRGNVVVSGATGPGPTDLDAHVAAFSEDGDALWASTWGGVDHQIAASVAACSDDDVVVAGQFAGSLAASDPPRESAGKTDVFALRLGR